MKIEVRHVMAAGLAIALVSVACAVLGVWLLGNVTHSGVNLSIDGAPVTLPQLQAWPWTAASAGGLFLALLLVLAVPLGLALTLALAGLGLLVAMAALLVPLGLVLLIAFSPLWLLAFALWWALRRKAALTGVMPP